MQLRTKNPAAYILHHPSLLRRYVKHLYGIPCNPLGIAGMHTRWMLQQRTAAQSPAAATGVSPAVATAVTAQLPAVAASAALVDGEAASAAVNHSSAPDVQLQSCNHGGSR